jgi:hypothetical protein
MFVREKTARGHTYLYLVESVRKAAGKLNVVLDNYSSHKHTAPTGRAAKRLSESTG